MADEELRRGVPGPPDRKDMRTFTLRIRIHEGRNLPREISRAEAEQKGFLVAAAVERVRRNTAMVMGTSKPLWDEALEWELDEDTVRRLIADGAKIKVHCIVHKGPGKVEEVGWCLLDVHEAKMNDKRPNEFGDWHKLQGHTIDGRRNQDCAFLLYCAKSSKGAYPNQLPKLRHLK